MTSRTAPSITDESGEPLAAITSTPTAAKAKTNATPAPSTPPPAKGRGLAGRVVDAARRAIGGASVAAAPGDERFEVQTILGEIITPDASELRQAIQEWKAFESRVAIVTSNGRERRRQEIIGEIHGCTDPERILALALEASLAVDRARIGELHQATTFASRTFAMKKFAPLVERVLARRDKVLPRLRREAEGVELALASKAGRLGLEIEPRHLSEQIDTVAAVLLEFEQQWKVHLERLHFEAFRPGLVETLLARID